MLTKRQLETLKRDRRAGPNRLGLAMALAGLTQIEVATRTGLTQSYISKCLNGRVPRMSGVTMFRFARLFGCAVEDLFPLRQDTVAARS